MSVCFRVMIWQPFAFYILPISANPSKTAFSSLTRKLLILKLTSSFFFFMKIHTTLLNIFETSKKKVEKFRGADHTSVIDEGSKLTEVTMK